MSRESILEAALSLQGAEVQRIRPHFTHDGAWDWECVSMFGCPSDAQFVVIPLHADDAAYEQVIPDETGDAE